MSDRFRELQPHELAAELERILLPRLSELLRVRAPGHCMRVTDLNLPLMIRLCAKLRIDVPTAQVMILNGNGSSRDAARIPHELSVTSTKLVELRNPLPDGCQRPPLMVFLPTGSRSAAEDSFGVATFEDVELGDVYDELRSDLTASLPDKIRRPLAAVLHYLANEEPWAFADKLAMVRFLATAKINGHETDAIGAALYELGLIPDFELFQNIDKVPSRIKRNRECVAKLTWSAKSERGRVLDLGLVERGLRVKLGHFLANTGIEEPRAWTRQILLDRDAWALAFHRWAFEDDGDEPDRICIANVVANLPEVPGDEQDERIEQLIGQKILTLGKNGVRKFNVTFEVAPHPAQVQGLARFAVQVVSRDHGPIGFVRRKSVWKGKRLQATVPFNRLSKVEWQEGWHFFRVLALTEDDELIPLVDLDGEPLPWASEDEDGVGRPNESDLFYVLPDGDVELELPQRAVQREASLLHALTRVRFTALLDERDWQAIEPTSVVWTQGKGRAAGSDMLTVKLGREGAWQIPVSRPLKRLEQRILASADELDNSPLSWQLPIIMGRVQNATTHARTWPRTHAVQSLLVARRAYFQAVRCGVEERITQAADVRALQPLIVDYANAYPELLQELVHRAESNDPSDAQSVLTDLRNILALDTIAVTIRDHRGLHRDAALVAPTHPLRALWMATWARLSERWLTEAAEAPRDSIVPARDALLELLTPVNVPPVLATGNGRLMAAVDNLHPFWTLYAPPDQETPRGLLGDVCAALNLPEPAIGGATIDGKFLSSRIKRYLVQHPYVRALVINAFNAGRASVLADMLLDLQKQTAFADIRYDIRLYVADAETPGVGEALAALLSPTTSVTAREADAFSVPSKSHLSPKLSLAIRQISKFRRSPERHPAHLTFLFDLFPAEDIGAENVDPEEWSAPVHGLMQDFHQTYREDGVTASWSRTPRHGVALPLAEAEELTDLLSALPAAVSSATALAATGEPGQRMRPIIKLTLNAEDRALLHQVHEVSDWVVTLDRNMGIELFDHGGLPHRPDYLIDHSPDMVSSSGHRLAITSRSLMELEAMMQPVLEQYGLASEGRLALPVLDQLRSLSGRLALKLISASNQRAEALGLALSRMYLEHQGVFQNQIVIPLDAHLELYRTRDKSARELGDDISFKRTDLALFDLNARTRTITCRLVEVKCYNGVGDIQAFQSLKENIAVQINQSQEILGHHFDPRRSANDRPDRLVKSHELATLLEFYLARAIRHGAIEPSAATEARFLVRTLEDGYQLRFTRSALIFDFEKPGTEPAEVEHDIEYHRIGIDLIRELLTVTAAKVTERRDEETDESVTQVARRSREALLDRREHASVPTLESAGFLSPPRDHSVSWEELHARRTLGKGDSAWQEGPRDASDSLRVRTSPPASEESGAKKQLAQPKTESDEQPKGASSEQPLEHYPRQSSPEQTPPESPTSGDALEPSDSPSYDVLLGVTRSSPQYGLLGETSGRKVAIDLNEPQTISLFGVQGGGKSYTLGVIAEMATLPIPRITAVTQPLATVIFHYSSTMDYRPEFTSMIASNSDARQVAMLRERYGAEPRALSDVVLLAPADRLEERRAEYPAIQVHPLAFTASELKASHWRFLMGAVGNRAAYVRQINRVIKALGQTATLEGIQEGIERSKLSDHLKDLAHMRLEFAGEYIDDSSTRLSDLIHPGRLIIVDLRDQFIEKDQALGLFVVLLQLFADANHDERPFSKLVVFDEAHKYIDSPDLVAGLIEVVREMRHKRTSIMVASQDPPSVPVSLIELSSQIILHKFNSPAWLKHIQKANASLSALTPKKMSQLRPGEAFIWSSKATDAAFSTGAVKVTCRPRVTQHGGATKTAIE